MMSPLQIERSLSVHSGTTGKGVFFFGKLKGNGGEVVLLGNLSCLETLNEISEGLAF